MANRRKGGKIRVGADREIASAGHLMSGDQPIPYAGALYEALSRRAA